MVTDPSGLVAYALLCIAVHESGHFAALRFFRVPVEKVSVRLFGMAIELRDRVSLGYRQEVAVALAGCCANGLLCLAAWPLTLWRTAESPALATLLFSLLIGLFNLLPIGPLDGGRALEAALCLRLSPEAARKAVTAVSVVFLMPLAAAGFLLLLRTGFNFTLLLVAVYLAAMLLRSGGKKGGEARW